MDGKNKLKLNWSKTFHNSYSSKQAKLTHYFIVHQLIEMKSVIKDLGVEFNEHLTFSSHINTVAQKLNRIGGLTSRFAKEICTFKSDIIQNCDCLHHSNGRLLLSRLEPATDWIRNQLEKILHNMSRQILRSPFHTNYPRYVNFASSIMNSSY